MESTLKWVNRFTPLYSDVKSKRKICDIFYGTRVRVTGTVDDLYEQVIHISGTKLVTGWIHMDDLEDYVRNFATNVVEIENQSPSTTDFEQVIVYESMTLFNQCGEICVANVLNVSHGTILSKWKQKAPGFFKLVINKAFGKDKGTGTDDLIKIFEIFGRKAFNLVSVLYQPHINRARYTIKGLNKLLQRGHVIMSVKIDRNTGLLNSTGVLHWVVLKTILPERNGLGFVTLLNPSMNCIESYSLKELLSSAGGVSGLYIPYIEREPIYQTGSDMVWVENRN